MYVFVAGINAWEKQDFACLIFHNDFRVPRSWIKLISSAFFHFQSSIVFLRAFSRLEQSESSPSCGRNIEMGYFYDEYISSFLSLPSKVFNDLRARSDRWQGKQKTCRKARNFGSNIYFFAIYQPNYMRNWLRSWRWTIRYQLFPHVELSFFEDNCWRSVLWNCKETRKIQWNRCVEWWDVSSP